MGSWFHEQLLQPLPSHLFLLRPRHLRPPLPVFISMTFLLLVLHPFVISYSFPPVQTLISSSLHFFLLKHDAGHSFVVDQLRIIDTSTRLEDRLSDCRYFITSVHAQGANGVAEPLFNRQKILTNELEVTPDKNNNKVENVTDFVQEDFDGNVREDLVPLEIPLPQTTHAVLDGNPTPSPPASSLHPPSRQTTITLQRPLWDRTSPSREGDPN